MSTKQPSYPSTARAGDSREVASVGGNLQGGIAGNYDFEIGALLSEAWARTSGLKGPFWGGALVVWLVFIVVGWTVGFALQVTQGGVMLQFITPLVVTAAVYPFLTGVVMQGVHRAVDLPVSFRQTFGYLDVALPIVVAGVLSTILINIGFILLIIPGVYLSLAYLLVAPLIADKKLQPWQAMEVSRKAITHRWFKVFFLLLAMSVIIFVSMLPLFIGLIWTYPMSVVLIGILYRDIFGVDAARNV